MGLQKLSYLLICSFRLRHLQLSFFVLALGLFPKRFERFTKHLKTIIAYREVLEAALGQPRLPFLEKLYRFLLLLLLLLKHDENFCSNVYLDQNQLKFYLPHFEFQLFYQIGGFSHFLVLLNLLFFEVFQFFIMHFFFFHHYYLLIKTFTLVMLPCLFKNLHLLIQQYLNQPLLQSQTHRDYQHFLINHHPLLHKLPFTSILFFHKLFLLPITSKISIHSY